MELETRTEDRTLARLEAQILWFDEHSTRDRQLFKWLKVLTISSAVAIPIFVTLGAPSYVAALLGGAIALTESLQHLKKYQENWIQYRSTAETLKHEKYLYLRSAGPYRSSEKPTALLAGRIEALISQEHAHWVSAREESPKVAQRLRS